MKITRRFLAMLLAVVLCMSCAPTAFAADAAETFSVSGSNMTLGNELVLNFLLKKATVTARDLTAYVTHHAINMDTGEAEDLVYQYPQAQWLAQGIYYKIPVAVAASQMTDEIEIVIKDSDGNVCSNDYSDSVCGYFARLYAATKEELAKPLMVDMLNYGASAQTYFGYKTETLANAELTEEQQALATPEVVCTNAQEKDANYYGTTLSLKDCIELNFIFKGLSGKAVENMYAEVSFVNSLGEAKAVTLSGDSLTAQAGGARCQVKVKETVLADASELVSVTLYADGEVFAAAKDSVQSYVSRYVASKGDPTGLYGNIMKLSVSAYRYIANKLGIDIESHNWNSGELTLAPTETKEGIALYTCLDADCGKTKTETIKAGTKVWTRADLEVAVEELSWDYLLKKDKIQYDSMELDAMGKYYSGKYLVTEGAAPEYGTSHTEINSVCSDYVWKVYEEALHHNLLGVRSSLEAVTADMWYCAENQYYTDDEEDIDSVLVRWQSLAFTDLEKQFGVPDSPHFVETKEEVFEYFLNWETMLRPGDVLVDKGHALIYAGNGKVLHCNGTKYQPTTGVLNHEDNGSVNGVSPLSCTDTSWLNTRANTGRLVIWRPTEFLVTKDTDGDLSNDMVRDPAFAMPADTLSRLAYPGMEIDRTVDITPYGTASVGQELTYSVKISNMTTNTKYLAAKQVADSTYAGVNYENLLVTETVPAGTELVSVTENGVYDEASNTITWELDLAAGRTVTPSYTVKVTADIGETIVSGGGFVADIPSNSISNRVGGVKMNEFAEMTLADIAASDTASWTYGTDLAFAEAIYEATETTLELPTVSELVDAMFEWTSTLGEIRNYRYAAGKDPVDVFMLRADADMDMIIPAYYGGYRFFTGSDAIGSTISEFRFEYLEPGDIIVNCNTANGEVTDAQVMVHAGSETLLISNADGTYKVLKGTVAKQQLWKSFLASNDLFFALRPSQASDLKAAHTWDEGTVTKAPTCAAEGEMTYTCLDDGCGKTKTKVLEKTADHVWNDAVSDNGNGTHLLTCTLCGATKSQLHDWDDGVGDGTQKLFTCLSCGAEKTEYGGLTEAQIKLLQSFTYHKGSMAAGANSRQRPVHYADTIYEALCMDGLVELFNGGLTAASALNQAFKNVDAKTGYGPYDRDYVLRTEANGYLEESGTVYQVANMVVDGFYGGTWLMDVNGDRLTDRAKELAADDLQPGDVILMGENTASFTALLWTLVYQGRMDGQDVFIFGNTYYGSYNHVGDTASYRGELRFDAETGVLEEARFNNSISSIGTEVEITMDAEIGKVTFREFLTGDIVSGVTWEYFYAIRPCKVLGLGTHTWDAGVESDIGTTYTCTVCGETKIETVLTHTWDAGTVTKVPTCGAEGEMTYTCTDCGETTTEVIPATDEHSFGEAADDGNGYHTSLCSVCGEPNTAPHTFNEDGTACTICGAIAEEVDYVLTDDQIAALQTLTYHKGSMTAGANSRQRPVHFADTIYAAIGLDGLVEKFNGGLTAASVLAQPFQRLDSAGSVYGQTSRDYVLRTAQNGYLVVDGVTRETALMMVDGFYGGSWIVDGDGNRLTDAAASMNICDLQPGDVLLLGENTSSYDALLWVLVYQGTMDGKDTFIFGNTYYGSNYTNVSATTSYRGKLCFDAKTGVLEEATFNNSISSTGSTVAVTMEAEVGKTTINDFLQNDLVSGVGWEYFYAIRPGTILQ